MHITVAQGNIVSAAVDCLVVNLFQGVTLLGGATGAVDQALNGAIQGLIASGDFDGSAGKSALLYTQGAIPAPRVLIVGLGPAGAFDLHAARRTSAVAVQALTGLKGVRRWATIVHGAGIAGLDSRVAAQVLAEGSLLAAYRPKHYPPQAEEGVILTEMQVVEFDQAKLPAISAGVAAGQALAAGICSARDYVNEPPNVLFPGEFAARAQSMASQFGLGCTILGETGMATLGMGILLAVSQGSEREAQLVILEHTPAGLESSAPLVLVGKGITFDTGGISLKAGAEMWKMKDDMGGAAAVIGAMESIARLGVARRVIGVAACVENMPDGKAFRPGDILTGITGKTTEIISTDAEGRLVLADSLGYVARYNPAAVVDLATLTGAIGIALGTQAAGCFANHDGLQKALLAAAEVSGERLWPMPMYEEYTETIQSDMAQVRNSSARFAGVSASAKFIEHFTEGYPWAHLDIASMVFSESPTSPLMAKGATGYGVRLLVALAQGLPDLI